MFFLRKKAEMVSPEAALAGRASAIPSARTHFVNGAALKGPYPAGHQQIVFGLGCFWGAERKFWQLGDGVTVTAVGYAAASRPTRPMRRSAPAAPGTTRSCSWSMIPPKFRWNAC